MTNHLIGDEKVPISTSDVVVGGVYATPSNQERRVVRIVENKVHYDSRGGNVQNDWAPGHTKARPPSLEKFADSCDRVVSKPSGGTRGKKKAKKSSRKKKA